MPDFTSANFVEIRKKTTEMQFSNDFNVAEAQLFFKKQLITQNAFVQFSENKYDTNTFFVYHNLTGKQNIILGR